MTCYGVDARTSPRAATALAVAALAALAAVACAPSTTRREGGTSLELVNPRLGPEYSQWLVGPIARLATPTEGDRFLALADDAAAAVFVDAFWAARDPDPAEPGNPAREGFDARVAEADKRYSESGYLGRRTARGTIHVLFGPPEETDYEIPPEPKDPPIELWKYPADAKAGLSGERPARIYRFIRRGDVTVFYVPRTRPDLPGRIPRIDQM